MKARAEEKKVEATASDLANDESSDSRVVGYTVDESRRSFNLVTLEKFTGKRSQIMIAPHEVNETLSKLKSMVKMNSRIDKKRTRANALSFGSMAFIGFFSTYQILFSVSKLIDPGLAPYLLLCGVFMVAGVIWASIGLTNKIVLKRFLNLDLRKPEGVQVLSSKSKFKSLMSGVQFERGAPSHETLFEAVQLLNRGLKVKERLKNKRERRNSLKFSHKNNEIREEFSALEIEIDVLERELRELDEKIKELLLREED